MWGSIMAQALSHEAIATVKRGIFDVGINEKLPLNQLLILGFQNVFGMPGMFVFPGLFGRAFNMPPEQIAYLYGMIFLVWDSRPASSRSGCCGCRLRKVPMLA